MECKEIFDKLGIEKMINRSESAEDPNIRFSKFDICNISGIKFKNGEVSENYNYKRISHIFESAYLILEKYGYHIDENYTRYKGIIPSKDYSFKKDYYNTITIEVNPFHSDLFKITHIYGFDQGYHNIEKLEDVIMSVILYLAEKNDDLGVLRQLNIDTILE